jgi:hypothetical protein
VAPSPAATAPTPKPPEAPRPAAGREIEIDLRTRPAGAEVFEGAERLGMTPLHLKRQRGDAAMVLTFRHAGYKDERRDVVPNADKDIEVVLDAKRERVAHHSEKSGTTGAKRPDAPTRDAPDSPQPRKRVSDLRNPFE